MAKQKTQLERLQEHAVGVFEGRTDLISVDAHIVGRFVTEDGSIEEVELGVLSGVPRTFKPNKDGLSSKGFYLFGKVPDLTTAGQIADMRYQCSVNIVAVHSNKW